MNAFRLTAVLVALCGSIVHAQWQQQAIDTDADFRGLCVVSPKVAWVSGTKGTYGRTTDGGKTWTVGTVAGADKLDFRDVEAFGENTAYLLSAGPGGDSRIYKTTDGGKTWALQFKNADPTAFFDALAFWDEKNGIALGDPVKGGSNWSPRMTAGQPGSRSRRRNCQSPCRTRGRSRPAAPASSPAAKRTSGSSPAGPRRRGCSIRATGVASWTVSETPIRAGIESAGIFSIAFRDKDHGVIVGGDYRKPDDAVATAAMTADGGKTWTLIEKPLAVPLGRRPGRRTGGSPSARLVPRPRCDDGTTWTARPEKYNSVAPYRPARAGPSGRRDGSRASRDSSSRLASQLVSSGRRRF